VTATLKQLDPTRVELEIPISTEELEAARDEAYRHLVKRAKVPGFRPGKVPRGTLRSSTTAAALSKSTLSTSVVPRAYIQSNPRSSTSIRSPIRRPRVTSARSRRSGIRPRQSDGQPFALTSRSASTRELKSHKSWRSAYGDEEVDTQSRNTEARRGDPRPGRSPVEIGDVSRRSITKERSTASLRRRQGRAATDGNRRKTASSRGSSSGSSA
jgi:hypothetical protein